MPERLGKYELRGVLGKGAMGVVYDAWDPAIERRVAVKTIRLPDSGDENEAEEFARFKREAQAAGRLSHPGIVGVYDYGDTDSIAYIAMELVEGRSLKAMLDAEQRLTPRDAVRVMKELLDALAYSHAHGVIHRDIKPTNILVTSSGALKITDFGIARIESSSMTQMGTVMGTPAYMSPEQFMGQTVDQRTDIYAAGVLLFQLLTGERPFEGGLTAIMHKVLHTTPPKPSDLSVTAPEAFDAVVARAMARRPEDRYPSAEAFSAALTTALEGGPQAAAAGFDSDATMVASSRTAADTPRSRAPTAPSASPLPPVARKPAAAARRGMPVAVIGGIVAVVVAAAAGGGYVLLRSGGDTPEPARQTVATNTVPVPVPATPVPAAPVPPTPAPPTPVPAAPVSPPPVLPPPVAATPVQPPTSPRVATPAPVPPVANNVPPIPYVPPAAPVQPAPVQAPVAPTPVAPLANSASVLSTSPTPVMPPAVVPVPAPSPTTGQQMATTQSIPSAPVPVQAPPDPTPATALRDVPCTLLDASVGPDRRVTVTGPAGTGGPEAAARAALAAIGVHPPALNWTATRFDGPYCSVIDTLRGIRNLQPQASQGSSGFEMSLRGGRTRLRNRETMAPSITAPPFPAYLQLVYFQSNGILVHLSPAPGEPDKVLTPGAPVAVGDPRSGGWVVGDPFGADMMVAVMSSRPLPAKSDDEPADAYLAGLRRAAEQAIGEGAVVAFRVIPIQTTR